MNGVRCAFIALLFILLLDLLLAAGSLLCVNNDAVDVYAPPVGCRLHTVSTGRGQGKPLMLCLHGFPELWFSWRKQMKEFRNDYEVCHP